MNVRDALPTAAEWHGRSEQDRYDRRRDIDSQTATGAPKVPGINAQPLQPSIGTDHYRLSPRSRSVGQLNHRPRPMAGRGDMAKTFAKTRTKKADPDRFAPMKPKGHRERSKGPRKIGKTYND